VRARVQMSRTHTRVRKKIGSSTGGKKIGPSGMSLAVGTFVSGTTQQTSILVVFFPNALQFLVICRNNCSRAMNNQTGDAQCALGEVAPRSQNDSVLAEDTPIVASAAVAATQPPAVQADNGEQKDKDGEDDETSFAEGEPRFNTGDRVRIAGDPIRDEYYREPGKNPDHGKSGVVVQVEIESGTPPRFRVRLGDAFHDTWYEQTALTPLPAFKVGDRVKHVTAPASWAYGTIAGLFEGSHNEYVVDWYQDKVLDYARMIHTWHLDHVAGSEHKPARIACLRRERDDAYKQYARLDDELNRLLGPLAPGDRVRIATRSRHHAFNWVGPEDETVGMSAIVCSQQNDLVRVTLDNDAATTFTYPRVALDKIVLPCGCKTHDKASTHATAKRSKADATTAAAQH
jgi:hypothetical protein